MSFSAFAAAAKNMPEFSLEAARQNRIDAIHTVLSSATRLKSFNENFRDDNGDGDGDGDGDGYAYDDGVVDDTELGALESPFDFTAKTARSRSLSSSASSSRPSSAFPSDLRPSSSHHRHPRNLPSLTPAIASNSTSLSSMRPVSAVTTGKLKQLSRASRPASAAAAAAAGFGNKDGSRSLEDEAIEVEELQRMVKMLKQQQHGSRENMLMIQQQPQQQQQQQQQPQQQQQQQQQSSAERIADDYRSSSRASDDVQQLKTLLQQREMTITVLQRQLDTVKSVATSMQIALRHERKCREGMEAQARKSSRFSLAIIAHNCGC
jgi:hypothetical protein